MNLYQRFVARASSQPTAPALIGPAASLDGPPPVVSYHDLWQRIDAVSGQLQELGVGRGDCVALMIPSGVAYIVISYAIWKLQGCIVPIAWELPRREQQRILDAIAITVLISDAAHCATLAANAPNAIRAHAQPIALGEGALALLLVPARSHPPGFHAIDAAFIRFTSGTTGTSKGVVLSHETIHQRITAANAVLAVGPQDAVLWLLSMAYHFTVSIVAYLTYGAAIIQCRNHLAASMARAASMGGASIIYGSPLHYEFLATQQETRALPRLRLALSTTAALRADIATAFYERFQVPLGQAYGIIELGLPCINASPAPRHAAAVGPLTPGFQLDRRDAGWGDGLSRLRLRGPGMFDAYYEPWRLREEVLDDGYFETGDLGRIDADGVVTLQGRVSEVINVGGMKFFPQEVEAVLEAHPAVAQACVFAYPDRRLGEVPHARVVLRARAQVETGALMDCCRSALALYQVPSAITLVSELPTTTSGKRIRQARAHVLAAESASLPPASDAARCDPAHALPTPTVK